MKRPFVIVSAFAMAALLGACASLPANTPLSETRSESAQTPPALFDAENVLILLESEQEASELTINVSRRGYQLRDRRYLEGLDLILLDFQRPPGISDEIAVSDMKAMSQAAIVGLDDIYSAQSDETKVSDPNGRVYANRLMRWPETSCRAQTSIGVIDGRLEPNSDQFPGAMITSADFTRYGGANAQHAESVASVLVGPGRLSDAEIYSAIVMGETRDGYPGSGTKELVLALNWMQANGVKLVNMSLSGPANPLLETAVSRLTERGMVIVAAVGNEGPNSPPRYPAAYEDVIAVTAIDAAHNVFDKAVTGPHVDYAAPGVDIYVGAGMQVGQYVSGTSFAAPAVTALIAADGSGSFNHNTEMVRAFLNERILDLGTEGHDHVFGNGLVRGPGSCATTQTAQAEGEAA